MSVAQELIVGGFNLIRSAFGMDTVDVKETVEKHNSNVVLKHNWDKVLEARREAEEEREDRAHELLKREVEILELNAKLTDLKRVALTRQELIKALEG